jgi:hypothetical protein
MHGPPNPAAEEDASSDLAKFDRKVDHDDVQRRSFELRKSGCSRAG